MLSKCIRYLVAVIVCFLVIVIGLQYYISQPNKPEELVCHKGKLLARVGDDEAIYTRIKSLTCDYEKGMLIIEEHS